jgi:hypothetical protein
MSSIIMWLLRFFPWVVEVLKDIDGYPSSKRVIAFISVFFMIVLGAANTFLGIHVEEFIFSSFRDIVIAGIGFAGAEKFTNRLPATTEDTAQ